MAYTFLGATRSSGAHPFHWLGLLAALGACGGDDADPAETQRFENIGDVQLSPGDGTMTVFVSFDKCLSSCDQNVGSCSARSTDGTVTIDTLLEVTSNNRPDAVCDAACWRGTATCQLETPAAGTYSVHSGLRSTQMDLPVNAPTQVFGDGVYYAE